MRHSISTTKTRRSSLSPAHYRRPLGEMRRQKKRALRRIPKPQVARQATDHRPTVGIWLYEGVTSNRCGAFRFLSLRSSSEPMEQQNLMTTIYRQASALTTTFCGSEDMLCDPAAALSHTILSTIDTHRCMSFFSSCGKKVAIGVSDS